MKPAASPAAAAVARRAARRKSAPETPPRRTLEKVPELFRRLNQPGFMRYGRPDDHGELREQE